MIAGAVGSFIHFTRIVRFYPPQMDTKKYTKPFIKPPNLSYLLLRQIRDAEKLANKALSYGELRKYDFYMVEVKRLRQQLNAPKNN